MVIICYVLRFPLMSQEERQGEISEIDFPGLSSLGQAIENCRLVIPVKIPAEQTLRHRDSAKGSAAQCKKAVWPSWSGNRRIPVITDQEIPCECVQSRQRTCCVIEHYFPPLFFRVRK